MTHDWPLERIDRHFETRREPARSSDQLISAFIDGAVTLRTNRPEHIIKDSGREIGYKHVEPGDLVISGMNAHLGAIGVSDSCGKCTPVYTVLRPLPSVDARYGAYSLRSAASTGHLRSLVNGVRYNSSDFSPELLKRLYIPLPPLDEQRRIANYLDDQTTRIDRAIQLRQQQLELVRSLGSTRLERLVLGHDAVESADSQWPPFGKVPRSWGQTRLMNLNVEVQTGPFGSQLHAEEYVEGGIPVVNPASLVNAGIEPVPGMSVDEETRRRLGRHILRQGDIVFARRGELGRCALVTPREEGWLCGTGSLVVRLADPRLTPQYLSRLLRTRALRWYFESQSVGSTMANLNTSILLAMPLLLPSLDEQADIEAQARDLESTLRGTQVAISQSVRTLKERRNSVVTGALNGAS